MAGGYFLQGFPLIEMIRGSVWFILPSLDLLFDMRGGRPDIELIFQVSGQLIGRVNAAMLPAGASKIHGKVTETALQIIFDGQIHDAVDML